MVIKINLFEFPTKEEMLSLLKESSLYNYGIESGLFNWTNKDLFGLIKWTIKDLYLSLLVC
ncbi:hypothetical protein COF84_25720 [Bacillus wiedmannii]|nr:hypothetical protein COF84_25720 [Bacillus wiedmannii]